MEFRTCRGGLLGAQVAQQCDVVLQFAAFAFESMKILRKLLAVLLDLGAEGFAGLAALVPVVEGFDSGFEASAISSPMVMVTMWMKKSRQEWMGSWGAWTSMRVSYRSEPQWV